MNLTTLAVGRSDDTSASLFKSDAEPIAKPRIASSNCNLHSIFPAAVRAFTDDTVPLRERERERALVHNTDTSISSPTGLSRLHLLRSKRGCYFCSLQHGSRGLESYF